MPENIVPGVISLPILSEMSLPGWINMNTTEISITLNETRTWWHNNHPCPTGVLRKRPICTIKEDTADKLPEYCYFKNDILITVYASDSRACYVRLPE